MLASTWYLVPGTWWWGQNKGRTKQFLRDTKLLIRMVDCWNVRSTTTSSTTTSNSWCNWDSFGGSFLGYHRKEFIIIYHWCFQFKMKNVWCFVHCVGWFIPLLDPSLPQKMTTCCLLPFKQHQQQKIESRKINNIQCLAVVSQDHPQNCKTVEYLRDLLKM